MSDKKITGKGGSGRGQGRKKTTDRGGLVQININIFADQAERLKAEGNQSGLIRMAIDQLISELDQKN